MAAMLWLAGGVAAVVALVVIVRMVRARAERQWLEFRLPIEDGSKIEIGPGYEEADEEELPIRLIELPHQHAEPPTHDVEPPPTPVAEEHPAPPAYQRPGEVAPPMPQAPPPDTPAPPMPSDIARPAPPPYEEPVYGVVEPAPPPEEEPFPPPPIPQAAPPEWEPALDAAPAENWDAAPAAPTGDWETGGDWGAESGQAAAPSEGGGGGPDRHGYAAEPAPTAPAPRWDRIEPIMAEKEPAAPVARPAPPWTVNTGFAATSAPEDPLDPDMSLTCDSHYFFWLEVGDRIIEGSLESEPVTLPAMPGGTRVRVAVFGIDGELEVDPAHDTAELEILSNGTARVVTHAYEPQLLEPDSDLLKSRIFFPVRTPQKPGPYHLRCNLYYEQILIQSRVVRAMVMRSATFAPGSLSAEIEYRCTRQLDPRQLRGRSPHQMSLLLSGDSQRMRFSFFVAAGEEMVKREARFDVLELQNFIEHARGGLRKIAWGDEAPWSGQSYRYAAPMSPAMMADDLIPLAIRGYQLYAQILGGLTPDAQTADLVARSMRKPGFVQIALGGSPRLLLPAALIYDYPLDTQASLADYRLCPEFLAAMERPEPLDDCACFRGECPSPDGANAKTTVCPSGFWGFRHSLGMPVSSERPGPAEIRFTDHARAPLGLTADPHFSLRDAHVARIRERFPKVAWQRAAGRAELFQLLRGEQQPHLVYFYCHGGLSNNVPYIQVGPETDYITRDNLQAERINWWETYPLVFINGCNTTALEPEHALEFVSGFVHSSASGVIGTEITVFEPLACQFAEAFFDRFLDNQAVGDAVRGARLALLKGGNPLGLAYTPFAMADLKMVAEV